MLLFPLQCIILFDIYPVIAKYAKFNSKEVLLLLLNKLISLSSTLSTPQLIPEKQFDDVLNVFIVIVLPLSTKDPCCYSPDEPPPGSSPVYCVFKSANTPTLEVEFLTEI